MKYDRIILAFREVFCLFCLCTNFDMGIYMRIYILETKIHSDFFFFAQANNSSMYHCIHCQHTNDLWQGRGGRINSERVDI